MAHPLRSDTNASRAAKLKSMTEDYGSADRSANKFPGVEKYKLEGPEENVGFGADQDKPKLHGARISRDTKPANPYATYKRGGAVKRRASGGDTSDIEQADIDQKLESRRRGGKVKHRVDGGGAESLDDPKADTSPYAVEEKGRDIPMSQKQALQGSLGQAGNKRGGAVKRASGGKVYPGPVKMGAKYATVSSEPSPTPVDNRARGGKVKGKGGTHVNIMVAPHSGQPQAPPVSAMPMPPPMTPGPRPPMGGPPPGGMPPGAGMPGMPPGGMPPPPGAVPPGIMLPRKRGGRVVKKHHADKEEDMKMIKSTVKESALKPHGSMRAAGGRVGLTAGAATGEGRLEKAAAHKRSGRHAPQEV